MKRALRRHHRERLFRNRIKKLWWIDKNLINDIEYLNKLKYLIDTPTPCSCTACGNPRKHFKAITRKEKASLFNMMEQCNEYGIYTTLRTNNLRGIEY